MPKSKTQETLTIQINKESKDANEHINFSSIRFYSQAIKIQRTNHQSSIQLNTYNHR